MNIFTACTLFLSLSNTLLFVSGQYDRTYSNTPIKVNQKSNSVPNQAAPAPQPQVSSTGPNQSNEIEKEHSILRNKLLEAGVNPDEKPSSSKVENDPNAAATSEEIMIPDPFNNPIAYPTFIPPSPDQNDVSEASSVYTSSVFMAALASIVLPIL